MYKPTKWSNRVKDEKGNIIADGTGLWAKYLNNMESGIVRANLLVDNEGKPNGIATLDENGIVHSSQLPANLKEIEIVYSLKEMEDIKPKFKGLRVMILQEDSKKWSEYVHDGSKFIEVANSEQFNIVINWENIKDKPIDFKPEAHMHLESDIENLDKYTKEEVDIKVGAKAEKQHEHTKSDISDLNVYDKEEIDLKLKDKSNINHTHKELHEHTNFNVLEKIIDLGGHDQVDLDKIYNHNHSWSNIQNKPTTFDPSLHEHSIREVTGLQASLNELDNKIPQGGVTGVNGKTGEVTLSGSDMIVSMSWSETISEVLWDLYVGKADQDHTHSEYVKQTDLPENLDMLEKLVDLGNNDQIDLDLIYTHKHKYSDIQNKPYIPDKITDLEDDVNLVTSDTKRQIIVSATEPIGIKEGDIWIRI